MNKKQLLEANLEEKIKQSKRLIMDWYTQFDGQVYIAFSGGKDSTVLLHLVRSIYPEVPAVFCHTGLEYPEIVRFARKQDNVKTLYPKMNFKEVIKKYGYPIISKNTAMAISRAQNTKSERVRNFRLNGSMGEDGKMKKVGVVPKKWRYIYDMGLKTTDRCCDIFKKQPFKRYEKETGRKPFIGTMAGESMNRSISYRRDDCNEFKSKNPKGKPIMFWNEDDIWKYARDFNVVFSEIYKMGEKRTGCMFCMYGVHLEKGSDRFERMSHTHPRLYKYCMDKLGLRKVLKIYMGKEYPT